MLLKDKRIFVVEDNQQNRLIFSLILRKHGAHMTFEQWGKDAVYQLDRTYKVDLIILDLMLAGGVTGFEIFDQIRALPKYKSVPIVAVSAIEPGTGIRQTRERGFMGFIAKPIDSDRFPQQLAKILKGEAVWDTGQPEFE